MLAKCPHCGHSNEVTPQEHPSVIRCPGCSRALKVPAKKPAPATAAPKAGAAAADLSDSPATTQDPDPDPVSVLENLAEPRDSKTARRSGTRTSRRRRRKSNLPLLLAVGSGLALVAIGGSAWVLYQRGDRRQSDVESTPQETQDVRYHLLPVRVRQVRAGQSVTFPLRPSPKPQPGVTLRFELIEGPEGATVDAESGQLNWNVPADAKGGPQVVKAAVRWGDAPGDSSTIKITLTVISSATPVAARDKPKPKSVEEWPELAEKLKATGASVSRLAAPSEELARLLGGELLRVSIAGAEVWAVWFDDQEQLEKTLEGFEYGDIPLPESKFPENWAGPVRLFQRGQWLLLHANLSPELHETLRRACEGPLGYQAAGKGASGLAKLPGMEAPAGSAAADSENGEAASGTASSEAPSSESWTKILALYDEGGKLFQPRAYETLRTYLSEQFAAEHADLIEQEWGPESGEFRAFLKGHPAIRDEFFLALDPQYDKLARALGLFKEIYEKFPDPFEDYANLAIATAVVWDAPPAVQTHLGPKRQAGATDGQPPATALGSFQFYLETAQVMQGRIRYLPWEMLVHVVSHETSIPERQWALQNYLARRVMIGKCYHDVPYDNAQYRLGSEHAKLKGQPYTLPMIRQVGGVCAHQADYSSRVARSIGVPGAYVTGMGRYGELHAWVMWVELKRVTASGIVFSLESHGRYRGDMYYVGKLRNPQTAKGMTDRELELYLHTVGTSPLGRRQAAMLMAVYPKLQQDKSLDAGQRLAYLRKTLDLSPTYDVTWRELAAMAGEEEIHQSKKFKSQMRSVVDTLFRVFSHFPDFTWEVFGNLVEIEEDIEKQNGLYVQLIGLYEQAKRPDLGFRARLVAAERLVEQGHAATAANLLAQGIQQFPDEGRFVPKVLDELEKLCQSIEDGEQVLIPFYASFLPKIPQKRSGDPSKYCMNMYKRAIAKFQAAGRADLAGRYQIELTKLQAIANQKKLRAQQQ